jgi:hypothetical protein
MAIVSKEIATDVEIEFDVSCNVCGKDLETVTNKYNVLCIEPCETCMQEAYDRGVSDTENKLKEK